jgi:chitinase
MKSLTLSILLLASGLHAREIIGYYPNWQWYDRAQKVAPGTIPYEKLTIINYAFLKPLPDGSIALIDTWADENLLKGEPDWVNGGYKENTSLIDLAHNYGVKVLASIGGWTLSDQFSGIAADPALTARFSGECIRYIEEYGFDGIDIDWEYPGYAEHNGKPEDRENFTAFLQAIRIALDDYGTGYLLTSCFSADPAKVEYIQVPEVSAILDFLNIMTYDFHGAFDDSVNHNSPLFAPARGNPDFCVDAAFRLYTARGAPREKINLGAPFYGRSFGGGSDALFGPDKSTSEYGDPATWSEDEGMPTYYNILQKWESINARRHWDDQARCPYLIYDGGVLSYDDEESIGHKAQYVVNNGAAGLIIWEITGDYLENDETPLLNRINEVFTSGTTGSLPAATRPVSGTFYAADNGNTISISVPLVESGNDFHIDFLNIQGRMLEKISEGRAGKKYLWFEIDKSLLVDGVFFIRMMNGNSADVLKQVVIR